jgi:hypothetical protein
LENASSRKVYGFDIFGKIALLHIDVDVYDPTKVILESLWHRVVKGGILMLDDYGTVAGETGAVDNFPPDQVGYGLCFGHSAWPIQ